MLDGKRHFISILFPFFVILNFLSIRYVNTKTLLRLPIILLNIPDHTWSFKINIDSCHVIVIYSFSLKQDREGQRLSQVDIRPYIRCFTLSPEIKLIINCKWQSKICLQYHYQLFVSWLYLAQSNIVMFS